MSEELKTTLKYLKSKNNTRRIKTITITEAQKVVEEIERLNNIINELENRDDVLEEFEDWLERQKARNSEWDNFIMVDGRLGIPISYLLNKLQELKGSDKE